MHVHGRQPKKAAVEAIDRKMKEQESSWGFRQGNYEPAEGAVLPARYRCNFGSEEGALAKSGVHDVCG